MQDLGRILIILGLITAAIGILVFFSSRIPFLGKLPGDILIRRDNFTFYFPLATSILISIILSSILYFFSKR